MHKQGRMPLACAPIFYTMGKRFYRATIFTIRPGT